MADSYLLDLMKRVVAMQLEAITPLAPDVGVDAVYKWPYQQNRFPYFTNRLGAMPVSGGGVAPGQYATDIDLYTHQILMRLVVAHLTQGIDTDVPNNVYDYIVQVEDYFREHPPNGYEFRDLFDLPRLDFRRCEDFWTYWDCRIHARRDRSGTNRM